MIVIKTKGDLENTKIERRSGFYLLCLDRPLDKIKDKDIKGILYIGKSTNLSSRLITVVREKWKNKLTKMSPYMFDHSALTFAVDINDNGDLVPSRSLINDGLLNNNDKLSLYVFYSENEKLREKQLLDAHVLKYGQLPAFNSQGSSLKSTGEGDKAVLQNALEYYAEIYNRIQVV